MVEIEFYFESVKTIIQCNPEESMETIINKFKTKTENTSKDLYFLYNGSTLDIKKNFNEVVNEHDKTRKKMNIIVNKKLEGKDNISSLYKSKYIICPECKENIYFTIKNFKVTLEDCKNGHKIKDILFNEFEKSQNIDLSKIICENCKKVNKNETFKNKFFICNTCNINLCPLCKGFHNKEHNVIDYDLKDFSCQKHNELYISYCDDCKKDICVLCAKEHNEHKIITYGDIMPEIEEVEKNINKLKETISEFKNHINEIILKLNKLMYNLDEYYKIYNDCIKNFDVKKRNYYIIKNTNEINNYNIDFINILKTIGNEKNIKNKLNNIIHLFQRMEEKEEINNIKIKFNTEYNVDKIIRLKDGRILTYQWEEIDKERKYKICVYNLNYDFVICDICIDIDRIEIIQMDDDNIIQTKCIGCMDWIISIIKIKKNILEEIQSIKTTAHKIIKLSNNKILADSLNEFILYLYQNNKLILDKKLSQNVKYLNDSCAINDDEIVIYGNIEGYISDNDFLIFYDIKNNKEIKSLKIGSYCYGNKSIRLINKDRLIITHNNKIILIDIINTKIINEFKRPLDIDDIFLLNINQINKFLINIEYPESKLIFCRINEDGKIVGLVTIGLGKNEFFYGIYFGEQIFIVKREHSNFNTVKIKKYFVPA